MSRLFLEEMTDDNACLTSSVVVDDVSVFVVVNVSVVF